MRRNARLLSVGIRRPDLAEGLHGQGYHVSIVNPKRVKACDQSELLRSCEGLKVARLQEINRQKSGTAPLAVASSVAAHSGWLEREIAVVIDAVHDMVASDPMLTRDNELLPSIPEIGILTAPLPLAEVPNMDEFIPEGLAAFASLSP